jgi:hypothetical protein
LIGHDDRLARVVPAPRNGSSMVAARLGRDCIGIELSRSYGPESQQICGDGAA